MRWRIGVYVLVVLAVIGAGAAAIRYLMAPENALNGLVSGHPSRRTAIPLAPDDSQPAVALIPEEGIECARRMLVSPDETIWYSDQFQGMDLMEYESEVNYYYIDEFSGLPRIYVRKDQNFSKTVQSLSETAITDIALQKLSVVRSDLRNAQYDFDRCEYSGEYIVRIHTQPQPGSSSDCAIFRIAPDGEILSFAILGAADSDRSVSVIHEGQAIAIAENAVQKIANIDETQWKDLHSSVDTPGEGCEIRCTTRTNGDTGSSSCQCCMIVDYNLHGSYDFEAQFVIDAVTGEILSVDPVG